jgi:hypothetical protein
MRASEFITEEEYDDGAGQLGQNPNMLKVNAATTGITDPNSRRNNVMSPEEQALWKSRAATLLARCNAIYAKLKSVVPPEDQSAFNGIKITVPLGGNLAWASAVFDDRIIEFDVGCFWDLSDDCIAYILAHEMGHIAWAFGPKKNWPKLRGQPVTPAQNRQEEMDADVYGAKLAMKLGYDRRKAWDNFTIAYQREPFDPKYPRYPSVGQRKANVEKAIQAQTAPPAQAQTSAPVIPTQAQQSEPAQPNTDMADKNAWLNHIMQGMQKCETALANDTTTGVA